MNRPRVAVLDYGSGNLRSVARALARAGADVSIPADPAAAEPADGVVVPGVGAFGACLAALEAAGWSDLLRRRLAADRPVLGICVGLQALFAAGLEGGRRTRGLARWPGTVVRLVAPVLPHMGWNTVAPPTGSGLFRGVADGWFYFAHSYAALHGPVGTTWCTHGSRFVAAVEDGSVCGTQFHPEKSGAAGRQLLANWLGTLR